MQKFLILWEINPEALKMYFIETDDAATIAKLEGCHGKLINHGMDNLLCDWVFDLINSLTPIYTNTKPEPVTIAGDYKVIHTGIML